MVGDVSTPSKQRSWRRGGHKVGAHAEGKAQPRPPASSPAPARLGRGQLTGPSSPEPGAPAGKDPARPSRSLRTWVHTGGQAGEIGWRGRERPGSGGRSADVCPSIRPSVLLLRGGRALPGADGLSAHRQVRGRVRTRMSVPPRLPWRLFQGTGSVCWEGRGVCGRPDQLLL